MTNLAKRPPELVNSTVFVIGAGPSLRIDDLEAVRASAAPAIVTNLTFRIAPWAWGVLCFDHNFIREYREQLRSHAGRLLTAAPIVPEVEAFESLRGAKWLGQDVQEHNSGSLGVVFAVASGARRVILLGMDCQRTGGATHWHGDHRAPLRNAVSMKNWPKSFDRARRLAERAGCQVVNATRETALTCFPRVDLGAELASLHRVANSVPAVKSEILIAPTSQIEKINI